MHVLVIVHGVFKDPLASDLNIYFLTGTSLWNHGSTKVALYSNKVRDSVKIKSAMTSLMCTYWQ